MLTLEFKSATVTIVVLLTLFNATVQFQVVIALIVWQSGMEKII